jgi:formyltetrahydrofolate deformylase
MKSSAILLISCPDRKGEVATIADFVNRHGGNIRHADEHADEESGLFLMRVEFDPKDFDIDLSQKDLADFGNHFAPAKRGVRGEWGARNSEGIEEVALACCETALNTNTWVSPLGDYSCDSLEISR